MMDRKIEIPLVSTFVPPHFSFFDYFNNFFVFLQFSSHLHNWITWNLQKEGVF